MQISRNRVRLKKKFKTKFHQQLKKYHKTLSTQLQIFLSVKIVAISKLGKKFNLTQFQFEI